VKRDEAAAGWTVQAYRFALDPSEAPVLGLRRTTGVARLADNHMLRRVSAAKAQRAAEAGYRGGRGGPDAVAGMVTTGPAPHLERDQAVGGRRAGSGGGLVGGAAGGGQRLEGAE
jgi:hypothetical protein